MKRSGSLRWLISLSLMTCGTTLAQVPGDSDSDGDIDLNDFEVFSLCQAGPDAPSPGLCQEHFDLDFDNDQDLLDLAAFQRCFSGDKNPANPDCVPHVARIEGDCLHIIGTAAGTDLVLRLRAGAPDTLDIDVDDDGAVEFSFDRGLFTCIIIDARGGDDEVRIDDSNGIFTTTEFTTIRGGSGADTLRGGAGAEVFEGGDGNDFIFMGAGSDRSIWNAGDDSDFMEGEVGADVVEVNGADQAETFTVVANGTRVRFDRLNLTPFALDIGSCEALELNANGGDDEFFCTGNLAALISITANGGPGRDTLMGSNGADVLIGSDDDDFVDGQQGSDTVFMGDGNDTFQWDPGDGNDIVEGQDGYDTMLFNGSGGAELFEFSRNGNRVVFTRNIANIVMDLDDVEQVDLRTLGNTDTVIVNDMTGTDLADIRVNLAATINGSAGDGLVDSVVLNGTAGDDVMLASLSGAELVVTGVGARIAVQNFDSSLDAVRFLGLVGHDVIDCSAVGLPAPLLSLEGGPNDDILLGSVGADILLGGDHDDVMLGNGGLDNMDGGLGENVVIESGSNVTTGVLTLFGDESDNTIVISRDGAGNLLRNGAPLPGATVANTALLRVFGLGGHDTIVLDEGNGALPAAALFGGSGNDTLTGGSSDDLLFGGADHDTLSGGGGFDLIFGMAGDDVLTGGDGDDLLWGLNGNDEFVWRPGDDNDLNDGGAGEDLVEVNGGEGAETFTVTANGTRVRFDRLDPAPFVLDINACEDLLLNANGGDDMFSCTGNLAALIRITADGGPGEDQLRGSNGIDTLLGGDDDDFIDGQQGNDVVFMGAGDDTFQWDPGDGSDTIEGEQGQDILLFNGSAGAELYTFSANGDRLRFTRNLGNIIMDVSTVERVDLNALGGIDGMTVDDLTGTDVNTINISLAGTLASPTGDAAADTITVNGTNAADAIQVSAVSNGVNVTGLAAMVRITSAEPASDTLTINGLGGTDTITPGPGVTGLIMLVTNQ